MINDCGNILRRDRLEQAGRNPDHVSIRTHIGDAAEEFHKLGRADDGVGNAGGLDQFLLGDLPMWRLAAPRNGTLEIAGPERAPFNEIVARYLKRVGDRRQVVSDPEARYSGGRVEERSLVPLGEARLGRIGYDEWLRRSQAAP